MRGLKHCKRTMLWKIERKWRIGIKKLNFFLFRTCSSLLCIFDILPCFQGGVLLRFKVQATTVALDSHGENMQVFVWDWIILVECVWPNVNLLGLAGHLKYAVSLPGYRIFTNSLALLTFFLKYRRVFLEQWIGLEAINQMNTSHCQRWTKNGFRHC